MTRVLALLMDGWKGDYRRVLHDVQDLSHAATVKFFHATNPY